MNPMGNIEPIPDPVWTGEAGELAIVVGRGHPPRTNLQMQRAVYWQAGHYLERWTDLSLDALDLALAVQKIADGRIEGADIRSVVLTREALIEYFTQAMDDTDDLRLDRIARLRPVGFDEIIAYAESHADVLVPPNNPAFTEVRTLLAIESLKTAIPLLHRLGYTIAQEGFDDNHDA